MRAILYHISQKSIYTVALAFAVILLSSCDPSKVNGPKIIDPLEPEKHSWVHPSSLEMVCTMPSTQYNKHVIFNSRQLLAQIMIDTTHSTPFIILKLDSIPVGMIVDSTDTYFSQLQYLQIQTDTLALTHDHTTQFEFTDPIVSSTNSVCAFTIHQHNLTTKNDTYTTHQANGHDIRVLAHVLSSSANPKAYHITLHYYFGDVPNPLPTLIVALTATL